MSAQTPAMPLTPVRVAVTDRHIARGLPGSCSACPLALAVAEVLAAARPGWWLDVSVSEDDVLLTALDGGWSCRLPATARWFIQDFDNGRPVRPFRFTLAKWALPAAQEAPDEVNAHRAVMEALS